MSHVVYSMTDPRDGKLVYVGYTARWRNRLYEGRHYRRGRTTPRDVWIGDLLRAETAPLMEVLAEFERREDALQYETAAIGLARAAGCDLLNVSSGGKHGRTGVRLNEASRIMMSRRKGGRPFCDQFGTTYETIKGAARVLGIPASTICAVLKGRRKSTKGYRFTHKECAQ